MSEYTKMNTHKLKSNVTYGRSMACVYRVFRSNGNPLKYNTITGKPVPTVMWYRDDVPMATDAYVETSDRRSVRHEITVGPLSRQDLNSRLACKAINHPRAPPLESTVLVDMNCKSAHVGYVCVNLTTTHFSPTFT